MYGEGAIYVTQILIALIIIFTVLDRFGNRQFLKTLKSRAGWRAGRRTAWIVVLLLMLTMVAGTASLAPAVTKDYIFGLLYADCLAGVLWLSRLAGWQIVFWLWVGAVFQAIIGIVQFFTQRIIGGAWFGMPNVWPADIGASVVEQVGERVIRAYGLMGSPNALGIYLAVAVLLGWWWYHNHFEKIAKLNNIGYWLGQGLITVGLFFSFSRSSWLAVFAGAIWFMSVSVRGCGRDGIVKLLRPVIATLTLFLVLTVIYWPLVQTRMGVNTRLENKSVVERISQVTEWKQVFYNRVFAGIGPGVYTYALYKNNPTLSSLEYQPVHNIYLLILAEWGMLGATVIFSLLAIASGRITRQAPWWGSLLVAWLVFGMIDHWTVTQYPGLLFTAVIFGVGWKSVYGEKVGLEVI